jgi:hypothetical protein
LLFERGVLVISHRRRQDLRLYGNKFDQWTARGGAAMRTVSKPKSLDDFTPR